MEEQDTNQATYCSKFEKENGLVNPREDDILEIYNKYRAFYLWPKIFFVLENGKKVIIDNLEINEQKITEYEEKNTKKSIFGEKNELNCIIKNITFKPEWKWSMDLNSFVNWYLRE